VTLFDLKAVLRLDDKFSSPLEKILRKTERTQKTMQQLSKSTEHATRSTDKLASGFGRVGRASGGLNGIGRTFVGIGAAIAGATAAATVFDKTIKAAAQHEQSSVMINAMFNDKKLAKQYMDMVDRVSISSPILDSQGMYANSKSFIAVTKDIKQLESFWSLAERMAAVDPMQGLEGAVFALRELASGDAVSMVERFEMPRKVMNDIKKMKLPDQLKVLDKYFNKIGMSQKLVEDMGGTTLGLWAQIKESVAKSLREMGAPALKRIREFLGLANNELKSGKLEDFAKFGAKMLDKIAQGFISAASGVGKWIDSIRNNPEFQKQTTLFGKVDWIINDVYQNFLDWYGGGGSDKIEKMAKELTGFLADSIDANASRFADVGLKIGAQISDGIRKGLAKRIGGVVEYDPDKKYNPSDNLLNPADFLPPKKNGGLNFVPYDGAVYSLHRGEQVLTRNEADEYRKGKSGKGGNTFNFTVNMNGSGSVKRDAEKLMLEMARLIESEGVSTAW
jgi:hypothetical protein